MSDPSETIPTEAIDFLGRKIVAGDLVVYPVRRGSAMWMNKLLVSAVRDTTRGKSISGHNDAGNRVILYNLTNCTVIVGAK